jgi:plasmid maintenance system antidote protein VapI
MARGLPGIFGRTIDREGIGRGKISGGVTQIQLSELTGTPQRHISEMENSKRPIGKEMAKRLGKALNISYKVFL